MREPEPGLLAGLGLEPPEVLDGLRLALVELRVVLDVLLLAREDAHHHGRRRVRRLAELEAREVPAQRREVLAVVHRLDDGPRVAVLERLHRLGVHDVVDVRDAALLEVVEGGLAVGEARHVLDVGLLDDLLDDRVVLAQDVVGVEALGVDLALELGLELVPRVAAAGGQVRLLEHDGVHVVEEDAVVDLVEAEGAELAPDDEVDADVGEARVEGRGRADQWVVVAHAGDLDDDLVLAQLLHVGDAEDAAEARGSHHGDELSNHLNRLAVHATARAGRRAV